MAKPRLYVETSVIGYLASRPSRDLVTAAHQQLTREWWEARRADFDLYVSQAVLNELGAGNAEEAARRLECVKDVPALEATDEALSLAGELIGGHVVPAGEPEDALHIAIAAAHGMEFLLTWNCAHIANALMRGEVVAACESAGFEAPTICTPEELMGVTDGG